MSGHAAGQPLECFVNQVVIHKAPLLDERGNHKLDEAGKPWYLCGFRIAGGIDQDNSKSPQGYPDKGVYVTYINEGSVAEKAGLKVHDKILQVNGHDMTMATHKKAVDYICRKAILEMFIYRPNNLKGGNYNRNDFNNKTDNNIGNLENEMNKMNVQNNRDQCFGDFEGNMNPDDRQGQAHFQPQPLPRTHYSHDTPSHGMPTVDSGYVGYGKQFEADQMRRHGDYPVPQQQKFPYSLGGRQTTDSGRNLDNYQPQHGPLKPPRWQQYASQEQQQQQQQRSPNLAIDQNRMHFDRNYNIGRQDQNKKIGAFESQNIRPKLSGDYRQEVNPSHHPSGPAYSHSAYQVQSHRRTDNSRNPSSQQPTSHQQQRSYGVSQSTPAYSSEKRSTLPSNPIFPSQNKFY